jgi:hypothetical protein
VLGPGIVDDLLLELGDFRGHHQMPLGEHAFDAGKQFLALLLETQLKIDKGYLEVGHPRFPP